MVLVQFYTITNMVWRLGISLLLYLHTANTLPYNYKDTETKAPCVDSTFIKPPHGMQHGLHHSIHQGLELGEKFLHDLHMGLHGLRDKLTHIGRHNRNQTQQHKKIFTLDIFKDLTKIPNSEGSVPAQVESSPMDPFFFESTAASDTGIEIPTDIKAHSNEYSISTTMKVIPSTDLGGNFEIKTAVYSSTTNLPDINFDKNGRVQPIHPEFISNNKTQQQESENNYQTSMTRNPSNDSISSENQNSKNIQVSKSTFSDLLSTENNHSMSPLTTDFTRVTISTLEDATPLIPPPNNESAFVISDDLILSSITADKSVLNSPPNVPANTNTSNVDKTQQNITNATEHHSEVQTNTISNSTIIVTPVNPLKNNSWLEQNIVFTETSQNFPYLQTSSESVTFDSNNGKYFDNTESSITEKQIEFPDEWHKINNDAAKKISLHLSPPESLTDMKISSSYPYVPENNESIDVRIGRFHSIKEQVVKLEDNLPNNGSEEIKESATSKYVESSLISENDFIKISPNKYVDTSNNIQNSTVAPEQDHDLTIKYNKRSHLQNESRFYKMGNNSDISLIDFDSINNNNTNFKYYPESSIIMNNSKIFHENYDNEEYIRTARSNTNLATIATVPSKLQKSSEINSLGVDTYKNGSEQKHIQYIPIHSENLTELNSFTSPNSSNKYESLMNDTRKSVTQYNSTIFIKHFLPLISKISVGLSEIFGVMEKPLHVNQTLINVSTNNEQLNIKDKSNSSLQNMKEDGYNLKSQIDDGETVNLKSTGEIETNSNINLSKHFFEEKNSETKVINKYKNIEFINKNHRDSSNLSNSKKFLVNGTMNIGRLTDDIENLSKTLNLNPAVTVKILQVIRERYQSYQLLKKESKVIKNLLKDLIILIGEEKAYSDLNRNGQPLQQNGTQMLRLKNDSSETKLSSKQVKKKVVKKRDIESKERRSLKIGSDHHVGHALSKRSSDNIDETTTTGTPTALPRIAPCCFVTEEKDRYLQQLPYASTEESYDYDKDYNDDISHGNNAYLDSESLSAYDGDSYDNFDEPSFEELISLAIRHKSRKQKRHDYAKRIAKLKPATYPEE